MLADLHEDRARETLATIEAEGGVASTIEVDVTVEEDARRLAETAIERYGRIDVLVNNVGISKRGSVLDVTPEEWDRVMAVNVKSMMLCSRHVVPRMKEGGGGVDNQHCLHRGPPSPSQHPLHNIQGCCYRADVFHGRRSRAGQHPCQRHSAGPGLHSDGRAPDGRGNAGAADGGGASRDGGDGMGCGVGGGVPGKRRGSVGYWGYAAGGRGAECYHGDYLPATVAAEVAVGPQGRNAHKQSYSTSMCNT